MKIKIISIPITGGEEENTALNNFLASHRVVDVEQRLTPSDYWTFCIRYVEKLTADNADARRKVDYRQVLSEEHFARFAAMRVARKTIAAEKALPAFTIFTDAELAEIAQQGSPTIESIAGISGIGNKRAQDYGPRMLEALKDTTTTTDETLQ